MSRWLVILVVLHAWWFTLPVGKDWFNGAPTGVKDYGPFATQELCDKAREALAGIRSTRGPSQQPSKCYER